MQYSVTLPDGRIRRMDYAAPMLVTVVDPEVNLGTPKRPIQLRDLVQRPVKDTRPKWNLGDMLSLQSVENLWTVYTALTAPEKRRKKALRAPHKA